ncbi:MAG: hypothetical protein ABIH03_14985 [Pseudomonadota bacterium]
MPHFDYRVRVAAFDWLDRQRQLDGETVPGAVLRHGFIDGVRAGEGAFRRCFG